MREQALAPIVPNAARWKGKLTGVSAHGCAVAAILERGITMADVPAVVSHMREIHKRFAAVMGDDLTMAESWALDWLEGDSPEFDVERGTAADWQSEWEYNMGELYDWADYNRVLVSG